MATLASWYFAARLVTSAPSSFFYAAPRAEQRENVIDRISKKAHTYPCAPAITKLLEFS